MPTPRDGSQQCYTVATGTSSTNYAIIDQRDPTPNDVYYSIGRFWINQTGVRLWYLNSLSNASGILQATWELISVASILASLSDTGNNPVFASSPSATPPDNIQIIGGSGITVVGNPGNHSLTISNTGISSTETLTGNDAIVVSPIAGNINTVGGTTVYVTGNAGTATTTANVVTTNHALLVGRGATTSAIPLAVGATNTVLLGNTGADPSFGQVPNAGLVNSSVTLNSGNNITVTGGSPLSLGGTASFNITGTTNNTIQLGNATGSLTSAAALTNGQLLIGSTGLAPAASTLTAGTGITITNGPGTISIAANPSSTVQTLTGNSGGAISPTAGNINTVGTGSITVSGSGSTLTTQLTGLTNHSILVGAGTSTITNVGPSSTIGQILQSQGATTDPAFSTATYPSTTTINQLLYSSSANTVGGLSTVNSSSLVTSSTGVPTWIGPMTNGQIVIGSTGSTPVSSTLTAGTGITITNGVGSVTIASANGAAVTGVILDAGTTPIVPNGSGQIQITGSQVATGVVGANVIRSNGTSSNTCTLQIQRTTTSGVSNSALNGVSHFSSTNFTVDANGFVQFVGGSSTFPWTDEGGNFSAASNNGYFTTAALVGTLPPTPAQGDIIRFIVDTTSILTVQANTGQKIRLGNTISALAGIATSTRQGDAIDLVYRAASATWYAFDGTVGTWGIT